MRELRDYLMIALGMVLYGIGWTVFLLPNDITTGGVPGIASIVYFATGFPVQYTYFAINFLLLLLALRVLGWKFSVKTIFAVFTLTFFLSIIQKLTEGVVLLHDQPFMACVIGASFCGSGIGIAFSNNGSTGGTDIIAAVINKYRDITLGRVMLICDLIIISSSYFVLKDWEKVVYGYVTLYICSFVLDQVVNSARRRAAQSADRLEKPRRAKPAAGSLSEADEKLLNALYAVRKRLAGKQNLPAFMVFNDATLREMAEKKPMSIDELLNISGVGEKKAARYGNAFLRVIEDAVGSRE